VVNMSIGGPIDAALDAAVSSVIARGCTVVVAAGNASSNACESSPANIPEALTTGASDDLDNRASFSNYGTCVDLYAPGTGIMSAWHTGDADVLGLTGTSMASPHVAGVVALFLEGNSDALPSEVSDSITAYSTKLAINGRYPLLYSGRIRDDTPIPPPPPPPAPVTDLKVTAWSPQDTVSYWQMMMYQWTYPFDTQVVSFQITGSSDTDFVLSGSIPADGRNVGVMLPPGTWRARLRAINDGGVSAWSNEAVICIASPEYSCGAPPPQDTVIVPPPPDTTTPPCRPKGKSGKCH
jgi:hypothetical protein